MIIHALLTAWGLTALMMVILWLVQVKTRNASYIDIGWTFGLVICVWVYAVRSGDLSSHKALILLLVVIWAARLILLLVDRLISDPQEDRRYARIRADWKTHQDLKFFLMFQFQGLLDVVLSWGFLLICLNPSDRLTWIEYSGVVIWGIGFTGELIADGQLKRFKAASLNKGKTCQAGLWKHSRHPNYFFEWLMWVAYFIMALPVTHGWTAIILPALMYYFLMHVSGVPLAEAQALRTKGEEYRRYQETTSMFIPWFRKKR